MSHITRGRTDDEGFYISNTEEDLFECKECKIEFSLESDKVEGKDVMCPICMKKLKAWQKRVSV